MVKIPFDPNIISFGFRYYGEIIAYPGMTLPLLLYFAVVAACADTDVVLVSGYLTVVKKPEREYEDGNDAGLYL